jgi:SpoVK/Ycf46/Vps4 family AAA+-type ATPase
MNEDSHSLTGASRRIREGVVGRSGGSSSGDKPQSYQSKQQRPAAIDASKSKDTQDIMSMVVSPAASTTGGEQRIATMAPLSDPEYVDLHELAKGWKAALSYCSDPRTRHEARVKNDRGNLPLHSAASFRAPVEVIEGLLEAYPEAASMTNNYGNLALHFTAWKKGPLDCMKLLLQVFPEGAAQKNNHGNLPLHYAAHYNAPIEVVEALYHAYPEAAHHKNNDSNTPLDLAVADGASGNVVALLQGKSVPPNDEEIYLGAKSRYERVEREMQKQMSNHGTLQSDLDVLLGFLMDVQENHPSAMYSSGIDPEKCGHGDLNALMEQVRIAGEEEQKSIEEDEVKQIEDSLVPPDDPVEVALSEIIGLDAIKNQIRGLRRTIEVDRLRGLKPGECDRPRHFILTGSPGCGKTYAARLLLPLLYKIGAVPTEKYVEVGRNDLVDARSEERTIEKTRRVLARARGGVLFVDEVYNLLPCNGRQGSQDHGPAALKVLADSLPGGDPLIILAGYALDLQRIVSSDIGFKGRFLLRLELPDPTPFELARMVATKLGRRGYILGEGLTARYISDAILSMGDDWCVDRNGRLADDLVHSIRMELRKKVVTGNDIGTLSPAMSSRMPITMPEEVIITVEDFQNAFRNGI